jgi:hypothetical protein
MWPEWVRFKSSVWKPVKEKVFLAERNGLFSAGIGHLGKTLTILKEGKSWKGKAGRKNLVRPTTQYRHEL